MDPKAITDVLVTIIMPAKWLVYALLALLLWGAWGAVLKLASRNMVWQQLYFYSGLATITAVVVVGLLNAHSVLSVGKLDAVIAVVAGVFGTLGYIFMVKSLEAGGDASIVVPLTALYPAVTAVIAFTVLSEKPTLEKIVGIVLAIVAVYLLSR